MTLPYLARLWCISLAACFLIHMALGMMVSLIAGTAVRMGEQVRPEAAARRLLVLRLLPAAGAVLMVLAVCMPSYLWLEPEAPTEHVGYGCLAAALLGAAMWGLAIARGVRALAGSWLFLRHCRHAGHPARLADESVETWIVEGSAPLLALGGLLCPRLLASRGVVDALPPEQLAVALRHERAHWTSHDNLKRLCILLAPGVLPFGRASRTIERGWRRFTEWAADDRAVAGNARRSCALAAALVRVARMPARTPRSPLALPLLGDTDQLAARVDRLLAVPAVTHGSAAPRPVLRWSVIFLTAAFLPLAFLQPAILYSVHLALEHLVK